MDPKLPPQEIEAERSVLGALMIDKNSIIKVVDLILPDDFYDPKHAKIYDVIMELFEKINKEGKTIINICLSRKKLLVRHDHPWGNFLAFQKLKRAGLRKDQRFVYKRIIFPALAGQVH